MIEFSDAYRIVLENSMELETEQVSLDNSHGRILAEDVFADRDFPPFNRVTKDGIAINHDAYENGNRAFKIQEVVAAGDAKKQLQNPKDCIEVMTGAILPKRTDTVIMYEHLSIENGVAKIEKAPKKGQDIHRKGSDEAKGSLLLSKYRRIDAAEIGVLASVGKHMVQVKKTPTIAIVSTGDELVNVDEIPKPHQIRKSNSYTLQAALKVEGIESKLLHFNDVKEEVEAGLRKGLSDFDVLLLSGGVSKGKFDYLPEVLEKLGVEKLFHRVKQRPGKPFWFGKHQSLKTTIFAFPGNPGSTFANYHLYFLSWLSKSLHLPIAQNQAVLESTFENTTELTRFVRASAHLVDGQIKANLVVGNGSGDLTSLAQSNGFVLFEPLKSYAIGESIPFYPTKRVL